MRRPLRIVSLLPSATEIICALGLEAELVGVTHECDFPAGVSRLPKVTRTLIPVDASSAAIDAMVRERLRDTRALYTLNLPVLEALKPDLIVTQALCDVCAVAEAEVQAAVCQLPGRPRVVNLEPQRLTEVFDAIVTVAEAAGVVARADDVVARLRARVEAVTARQVGEPEVESAHTTSRRRVALLEWLDPPFSCGHWNPELVRLAGGIEVLGRDGQASRTLTWQEVMASRPEIILIACCGFSVERTMEDVRRLPTVPGWTSLAAVKAGRIFVTDGSQYFSRPGPRLVDSLELLAHAIDPIGRPLPAGLVPARTVEVPA